MMNSSRRLSARCTFFVLLGLAGAFSAQSMAEPIYKSVDAQGNVTYSSEPVEGADKVKNVEIHPGPSEGAQEAARERVREMETSAGEIGEANKQRAQKRESTQQDDDVKPVEPVDSYGRANDDYSDPYGRARAREIIKNRPARPSQPIARPPAGRPGGAPGSGGRGR